MLSPAQVRLGVGTNIAYMYYFFNDTGEKERSTIFDKQQPAICSAGCWDEKY